MRWKKLEQSLSKSGIDFPEAVSYHRALSGLKLRQPSLGILLGTLESQRVGNSVTELRRISTKLFETTFIEHPGDVAKAEMMDELGGVDSENGDQTEADTEEHIDCFVGADGQVYELRKSRPAKTRNKRGPVESAHKNARVDMNWNNRSAENDRKEVLQAGDAQKKSNGCIRCGKDGHTWRRCNLPFQRKIAFPDKMDLITRRRGMGMFSLLPTLRSQQQKAKKTNGQRRRVRN